MNRKLVVRLLLDAGMAGLMIVLMGPMITGLPWHEILGTSVLLLFIVHCALNAWWFRSLGKMQKKRNFGTVIKLLMNGILLVNSLLLLVSSMMISHTVFAFLNLSGGGIWTYLHRVSAYTEFILISIHLGLHWRIILNAFRSALRIHGKNPVLTGLGRICSLTLAVFGIWASVSRDIAGQYRLPKQTHGEATQSGQADSTTVTAKTQRQAAAVLDQKNVQQNMTAERSFSNIQIEAGETENDFLGRLTCTGCGKHCPLTSPSCGTGASQAQQAAAYYQSQADFASSSSSSAIEESSSEDYSAQSEGETQKPRTQETTETQVQTDTLPALFRDYVPVMGMYAAGSYYLLEFVQYRKKKR